MLLADSCNMEKLFYKSMQASREKGGSEREEDGSRYIVFEL